MEYALIGVIGIVLCLIAIGIEFIVLYKMAQKDDNTENTYENLKKKTQIRIEGIIYAPTLYAAQEETENLAKLIGEDERLYELTVDILAEYNENYKEDEQAVKRLERTRETIDAYVRPDELYAKMLKDGDVYHKSHACRELADLCALDYIDDIRECLKSKDRNLAYNAAMALAEFGDSEKLAEYILEIQSDKSYSARIVNQFIAEFRGDRAELAQLVFENDDCSDYMRRTMIKALADYKIEAFRPMYIDGAIDGKEEMRVACIKALAEIGNPEDEHIFQVGAQHSNWIIRASSIKGLALINTKTALETVKKALSDKEWWVRQAAADCIMNMNVSTDDLEEILAGYDRFAADAVKQTLYKRLHGLE